MLFRSAVLLGSVAVEAAGTGVDAVPSLVEALSVVSPSIFPIPVGSTPYSAGSTAVIRTAPATIKASVVALINWGMVGSGCVLCVVMAESLKLGIKITGNLIAH